MAKYDGRIKITQKVESKIVSILRRWNSKVTWNLLIVHIKNELALDISKPTLRKFDKIRQEFNSAKARYKGVSKLSPDVVTSINTKEIYYYEKYISCSSQMNVLQEVVDEQYALIERILKNAEEIPNLDITDLVRERPEDM